MPTFCRRNEMPHSSVLRLVDSADLALQTIIGAAQRPECHQVIVLLLSSGLIGHTIVVVDETTSPDAVLDVIEMVARSADEAERDDAIVIASIRPGLGPLPGDVDRWFELSDVAGSHGCELIEWFVISGNVAWCPRDFAVEPPRWPAGSSSSPDVPW